MSQLKTRDEMNEMSVDELDDYSHELWLLYNQANTIKQYKREMEKTRILLNAENVIDVSHQLTDGSEEE